MTQFSFVCLPAMNTRTAIDHSTVGHGDTGSSTTWLRNTYMFRSPNDRTRRRPFPRRYQMRLSSSSSSTHLEPLLNDTIFDSIPSRPHIHWGLFRWARCMRLGVRTPNYVKMLNSPVIRKVSVLLVCPYCGRMDWHEMVSSNKPGAGYEFSSY